MEISESTQSGIRDAMLNIQNALLPTISNFSNELNVSQVQERVYHKLNIYEDEFNKCHVQARTPSQATFCGDQLITRLRVDMMQHIKDILDEYWPDYPSK